jgi:cysteine desulfuration protein SufE
MQSLADLQDEYSFLDLEPMPEALKTDTTLVRGCSASVWVYPTVREDGRLHFLADSNAAITKGIIALVLLTVQDQAPAAILDTDIEVALEPFDLKNQLSSNRTQGIPNMIALIRGTAARYKN